MRFLTGVPAAVVGKSLVIADLHLGIEFELRRKGILVEVQWQRVAEEINLLLKKAKCSSLIILGDAKHDVHGFEAREKLMVEDFVSALNCKKVIVTKGNHDGGIEQLRSIEVVGPEGFVLKAGKESYGLFHGHAYPAKELFEADYLLMGNMHPVIEFRDPLGYRWTQPAWIVGETSKNEKLGSRKGQKYVIFPAFSRLSGGLPMNAVRQSEYTGPLLTKGVIDLDKAEAVLVNGVHLGKIRELRKLVA